MLRPSLQPGHIRAKLCDALALGGAPRGLYLIWLMRTAIPVDSWPEM